CVDTNNDPANCGGCDQPVPDGATCSKGAPACGSATVLYCNGVCTDVSADQNNCGACNKACSGAFKCNGPAGPAVCSKSLSVTTYESCGDACKPYKCVG